MGFWHRISQSKLKLLSNHFNRFTYYGSSSIDYTLKSSTASVFENPFWAAAHKRPTEFCYNVRFYAAPYQAKGKKEEQNIDGPRLNEQIQAQFVRLVTDDGHNVVSIREALEQAKRLGLDLVEVQRNFNPPVCKLMDYNREKYKKKVKEKDRAKSKKEVTLKKGSCKEVRFTGKTEQKDLKIKADSIKRLMERGYRVKCMALPSRKKGSGKISPKMVSDDRDPDDGVGAEEDTLEERKGDEDEDLAALLSELTTLIEDVSIVESGPRVEARQAYVIVRHVKFGPSKKGGAKKSKEVRIAQPTAKHSGPQSLVMLEEDAAQSSNETEDEISSDEDDDDNSAWSVVDSTDNFEEVFKINDNNIPGINSMEKLEAEPQAMSSQTKFSTSDFSQHRRAHDSWRQDRSPSSPSESSLGPENRYKRSEPRDQFPPASEYNQGPDRRDSSRFEPGFSNQRRQPQSEINVTPSIRERGLVGTDSSALRNANLPHNGMCKQETSPLNPMSNSSSNYGIFSSPETRAMEGNKNREGGPYDNTGNSNRGGFGTNSNIPSSKSDGGQRPGNGRSGQGGWGIFSRDNPNSNPNRIPKSN